jgi:hypothetical protein
MRTRVFRSELDNVNVYLGFINENSLDPSTNPNHQRNNVETVFSILKRKFGESLKAQKSHVQVKELKIKLIFYNISKLILATFTGSYTKEFYRVII